MNTPRTLVPLTALLCCLVLVGVVMAQGSPNYDLSWNVIGGGGTFQSPHYVLSATGGQGSAGAMSSAHYRLGCGFWYAFGLPAPAEHEIYLPSILKNVIRQD